ncbi:3'-5' exonuclease [Penaeicola halotolerans]|uniref:3'-5' exonuclease n=1 Tax=Penaeicola halotolerans TaxID=2793196 RepID=UPI001CF8D653|nr:3'-5' exonuclease [Penaeicola halotolerans]
MKLNLRNPLVVFDLEATGTNTATDRIVEISMHKIMPNGEEITKTYRVNPTVPIPAEASAVHGIYDEDVKDEPTFKQLAGTLAPFLQGADLAGFNVLKYDIPLLVEEFLRAEVDFDVSNRKIIDAQKIFHMMEKRTLSAAYKFYCNKDLKDAHSAEADTLATYEVIKAQVARYDGQAMIDMSGKEIGKISNDMAVLHELTADRMVDLAGRFVLNNQGVEVFNFGKHKGRSVDEVLKMEPTYYDWMMRGEFPLDTKRKLTQIKLRSFNK